MLFFHSSNWKQRGSQEAVNKEVGLRNRLFVV